MNFDDSPVKKKRKTNTNKRPRPTKCIIHVVAGADDGTLSHFTKQSWEVCANVHIKK